MNLKYTLDERLERCRALRRSGYNCSQCVVMVFDDVVPLPSEVLAALSAGLGGGVGGQGEICGAVTAMAMIDGVAGGGADPAAKATVYKGVRELSDEFHSANGSVICRQLKGEGRKPCTDLILDAVAILHNYLEKK